MDQSTARIPELPQYGVAQPVASDRPIAVEHNVADAASTQLEQHSDQQEEMTIPVEMQPETDTQVPVTLEPAAPANVITDEPLRPMEQATVPEMASQPEHTPVVETRGLAPEAEHKVVEKPAEITSHQPQPVTEAATTAPEHTEHASPAHEAKTHQAQELATGKTSFGKLVSFLRTGTNAEAAVDLDEVMRREREENPVKSQ